MFWIHTRSRSQWNVAILFIKKEYSESQLEVKIEYFEEVNNLKEKLNSHVEMLGFSLVKSVNNRYNISCGKRWNLKEYILNVDTRFFELSHVASLFKWQSFSQTSRI